MSEQQIRLLVVDDDRDLLDSYRLVLDAAGYACSLATNSVEAINHLTVHQHHVALVDLRIRDEDGIELISRLQKIDPRLACIMITAYPSHETAVEALKLGAMDYLSKTAEPETILDLIEDAMKQRTTTMAEMDEKGAAEERAISVAVVCDNIILRRGLADMARRSQRLVITHFYASIPMFLRKHPTPPSNITLLCGSCNFKSFDTGIENLSKLRLAFPETHVVLFNQKMAAQRQVELLKMGVSGFLETDLTEDRMETTVCQIHEGQIIASPPVMMRALRELSSHPSRPKTVRKSGPASEDVHLTRREKEIIKCVARGLKNKQIGDQLYISEKTVKTHINNIFRKLGVENRMQAINRVYELNLLP